MICKDKLWNFKFFVFSSLFFEFFCRGWIVFFEFLGRGRCSGLRVRVLWLDYLSRVLVLLLFFVCFRGLVLGLVFGRGVCYRDCCEWGVFLVCRFFVCFFRRFLLLGVRERKVWVVLFGGSCWRVFSGEVIGFVFMVVNDFEIEFFC